MKKTLAKAVSAAGSLACGLGRIGLMGALLLGVSISAAAKPKARTGAQADLRITLRVYNYAGVPAGLLRLALDATKFIFKDAGIAVDPILCTQENPPAACEHVPDPLHIVVLIVPGPVPGADFGTLGHAEGQCITVNYSRVEKFADHSYVYRDRMLGCVLAHELGHVLLGPAHSATGIMSAQITDQEGGQIRVMLKGFLPSQKARIRAYVLAQTREPGADTSALAQR